ENGHSNAVFIVTSFSLTKTFCIEDRDHHESCFLIGILKVIRKVFRIRCRAIEKSKSISKTSHIRTNLLGGHMLKILILIRGMLRNEIGKIIGSLTTKNNTSTPYIQRILHLKN